MCVINDLCLNIPAGKTTAIVGASGSGKSTIVGLIERFYEPIGGKILIDGHDTSQLNLTWMRQQIALVNQEVRQPAITLHLDSIILDRGERWTLSSCLASLPTIYHEADRSNSQSSSGQQFTKTFGMDSLGPRTKVQAPRSKRE